jgi:hypothetical protein
MIRHTLRYGNELGSLIMEGMIEKARSRRRHKKKLQQNMQGCRLTTSLHESHLSSSRKWQTETSKRHLL